MRRSCAPSTRASTGAPPRSAPAAQARCSCSRLAPSRSCRATACGWRDDAPADTRAPHRSHRGDGSHGGRRPGQRPPGGPIRCGHRLERERGQGRARGVHLAQRRPAPRVADVRHDARGHPRRPECHRPPLASVRVRRPGAAGSLAGRRRGRGRSRRAGHAPRPASRSLPAGVHRRRRRERRGRLRDGARARSRDGRPRRAGSTLGPAAAAAILALRAADGSDTPLSTPATRRAPLPASTASPRTARSRSRPGWATVTPFVLRTARSSARPAVRGDQQEVRRRLQRGKRLGGDGVTTPSARTPDQTEIALFWVESSPLQWNRIARTVAAATRLDPWEQARLFGLLNMALADGYIGSFETKYHYNYWRPVTAIRARTPTATRDERRPDLDPAGDDATDPGLRLGTRGPRWRSVPGF